MTMPKQKPGRSNQSWQTPPEFLAAAKRRLAIEDFDIDLAASAENTVVDQLWFSEEQNSLVQDWTLTKGWCWLNPPYSNIKPWVEKCSNESLKGAQIACLVPASTGSNWWRDHVVNDAYILFLNGRITFVGADAPYPKDCALLLYTTFIRSGSAVWDWRTGILDE